MGFANLGVITPQLIAHGMPSSRPVAVISHATRQQTVSGTLETIVGLVADAGLHPPALVVVGEVVGLREELIWFENDSARRTSQLLSLT